MDPVHLERRGAVAFSEAVAGVVRPRLDGDRRAPGGRWVELPRYRPGPAADGLEGLDQSFTIARASGTARR